MFNKENIDRLERLIANSGEVIKHIGDQARSTGRMLTASEHEAISKARDEIQKLGFRLQHERAIAGAFGARH